MSPSSRDEAVTHDDLRDGTSRCWNVLQQPSLCGAKSEALPAKRSAGAPGSIPLAIMGRKRCRQLPHIRCGIKQRSSQAPASARRLPRHSPKPGLGSASIIAAKPRWPRKQPKLFKRRDGEAVALKADVSKEEGGVLLMMKTLAQENGKAICRGIGKTRRDVCVVGHSRYRLLRGAVRTAGLSSLLAIGYGGLLTAAPALAGLHQRFTSRIAAVATPLDAVADPLEASVASCFSAPAVATSIFWRPPSYYLGEEPSLFFAWATKGSKRAKKRWRRSRACDFTRRL